MKQTLKKLTGILMLVVFMLSFCACSSNKEAEVDETELALASSCEAFLTGFTAYTDEDLEYAAASGTKFFIDAAEAWKENREVLGELVEITETKVAETSGVYSVVMSAVFENKNADVTITFLIETQEPTSISFEPEMTFGEKMSQAALNTVMGIGTVFVVLIFLSFLISLFRFIGTPGKKKAQPVQKPAEKPAVTAAPVEEELADDTELVAVIAAAIAAYEGTSVDGFVVRSVKKVRKNNWKRA